jgi:hypothetical protein
MIALPFFDRHGAGLNDGLAGEIALGGDQRPSAVQGDVVAREGGEREEKSDQGSGNSRDRIYSHDFLPGATVSNGIVCSVGMLEHTPDRSPETVTQRIWCRLAG